MERLNPMRKSKTDVAVQSNDISALTALVQTLMTQNKALSEQVSAALAKADAATAMAATGKKPRPSVHGYLKPVVSDWVIDKGKRKGEKEATLKFDHFQNPTWGFGIGRNKAAALLEHLEALKEYSAKYPPQERE